MFVVGANSPSGYFIDKSLRFRASASAYLNKTFSNPPATGLGRTWTLSKWVKRGTLSTSQALFSSGEPLNTAGSVELLFNSSNVLNLNLTTFGLSTTQLIPTQVFRDPSAWYHIVLAIDTTQATASNRVKLYVNGAQVTAFSTANYPAQNEAFTAFTNYPQNIGRFAYGGTGFFDGYMAEIFAVDGQALTPSSFGETNALTGVWQPKAYTGTYGTNGFYLDFETTTSVSALGNDKSGNGNNWTVNNISLTSGVTYDSMTDVPTLTGETVANYAVLNPLAATSGLSLTNGNLTSTGGNQGSVATIIPTSGKWYWEVTLLDPYVAGSDNYFGEFGVSNGVVATYAPALYGAGVKAYNYSAAGGGGTYVNNVRITTSATWAVNDVIGLAFDVTNMTLDCYRNNVKIGTTLTVPAGYIYPTSYQNGTADTSSSATNFGQRPFAYTPPTGFKALNTFNLPTATILKGNTVMDATLYTGNGSSQSIVNAAGFRPDLIWAKSRSAATSHILVDSVRGSSIYVNSNSANGDLTDATVISAINSNGFSVGSNSQTNANAATFVGWQWQAGQGTTSTNTSGSITSTVSVNASAGFSVVTYTGTGTRSTIGHGLGVAPSLILTRARSGTTRDWGVYHKSLGADKFLVLNKTDAVGTSADVWNNTAPTSTTFSAYYFNQNNESAIAYVAYCWAEIDGFSKFGSYTGNGSTDGSFIYTGFRPKFILIKRTDSAANWGIKDTSRNPSNTATQTLFPNVPSEEYSVFYNIDILSNGFKCRASDAMINASGGNYIYAAFAENPFKNSLAR